MLTARFARAGFVGLSRREVGGRERVGGDDLDLRRGDVLGGMILPGRGRPKKGEGPGPMALRSIRVPVQVLKQVEKRAKAKGLTVHAALRTAIVEWIGRV